MSFALNAPQRRDEKTEASDVNCRKKELKLFNRFQLVLAIPIVIVTPSTSHSLMDA